MRRSTRLLLCGALALGLIAAACGGDDDDDGNGETPATSRTAASDSTPASDETAATTATAGTGSTPAPPSTNVTSTKTFTEAAAAGVLDAIVLKPEDIRLGVWAVMSDTLTDNAAAAAADPENAPSIERCGRLLGRTLTLQPEDQVTRYIGGETVSHFTNLTISATSDGAATCAAEAAARFSDPAELVGAFGGLFVNPAEVIIAPVEYPTVADGSFAATLSGLISAAGTEVNLTILIVAFREEQISGVVGLASAFDPDIAELRPYVDLVLSRIQEQVAD